MTPAKSTTLFLLVILPVFTQGMQNPGQGPGQGAAAPLTGAQRLKQRQDQLRQYIKSDGCPCAATMPPDGRKRTLQLAQKDCKDAMKVFKKLPWDHQKAICPNIRSPDCRKCGNHKRLHCGYLCDPTEAEIASAWNDGGRDAPRFVCRLLKNLVGPALRV